MYPLSIRRNRRGRPGKQSRRAEGSAAREAARPPIPAGQTRIPQTITGMIAGARGTPSGGPPNDHPGIRPGRRGRIAALMTASFPGSPPPWAPPERRAEDPAPDQVSSPGNGNTPPAQGNHRVRHQAAIREMAGVRPSPPDDNPDKRPPIRPLPPGDDPGKWPPVRPLPPGDNPGKKPGSGHCHRKTTRARGRKTASGETHS